MVQMCDDVCNPQHPLYLRLHGINKRHASLIPVSQCLHRYIRLLFRMHRLLKRFAFR